MRSILVRRLSKHEQQTAQQLFTLMSEVFGEERQQEPLSEAYLSGLLAREDCWIMSAFIGGNLVGGLTAYVLPMTRSESFELFIYDIAVHHEHQRKGIGQHLVISVCNAAASIGIREAFVPADNEDLHALDFYKAIGGIPTPVTFFTFATHTTD